MLFPPDQDTVHLQTGNKFKHKDGKLILQHFQKDGHTTLNMVRLVIGFHIQSVEFDIISLQQRIIIQSIYLVLRQGLIFA